MAYSQTKVIIGGLAHVPIIIFIFNLIKGKFASKTADLNVVEVKDEQPKIKEAELKKEEIKPQDDKKSILNQELLIEEQEKPEDERKSEVKEDDQEGKEVS